MSEYKIEMRGIHKTFEQNQVVALRDATLFVRKTKVHAVVGENGAGKTTLMNVLCGIEKFDRGSVFLDGQSVFIKSTKEAFKAGIGMVHQHFRLIDDFTVAENIVLGVEKTGRMGFIDKNKIHKEIYQLSNESGLEVSAEARISTLSIGQKQKVEILRMLYRSTDLIILDEPFSVLTEQEIEELFKTIRKLQKQGKTLILISHKLEKVMQIADEITILRNGSNVESGDIANFDKERISYLMVGENINLENTLGIQQSTAGRSYGDKLFTVEKLTVKQQQDRPADTVVKQMDEVKEVSFEIRAGELLAVVGVAGNGQRALAEGMMGLREVASGKIFLRNRELTHLNVRSIRKNGIVYIPEDRINEGSSTESNIIENILSTKYFYKEYSKKGWINNQHAADSVQSLIDQYGIKASSLYAKIGMLSGGNIKKVILAREFSSQSEVLIVCQPTWGLDVRSTKFVYDTMVKMRTDGKAILLISNNLDEVLYLADRILVMFKGTFVAELENKPGLSKAYIGEFMMGLHLKDNQRQDA